MANKIITSEPDQSLGMAMANPNSNLENNTTASYSPIIFYKYGNKKLFVYDQDDTSKCYVYYLKRPLTVDECKKIELVFDISDLDFVEFTNKNTTLYDKNTSDTSFDESIDDFINEFYKPDINNIKYVIKALPKMSMSIKITNNK